MMAQGVTGGDPSMAQGVMGGARRLATAPQRVV